MLKNSTNRLLCYPGIIKGNKNGLNMLTGQFPGCTWLLPFLVSVMTVILILLSGPCIFNCLARYPSSQIQLQLQMKSYERFQPSLPEEEDHQHSVDKVADFPHSLLSTSATVNNPEIPVSAYTQLLTRRNNESPFSLLLN